ncbi:MULTISPECIES: protein-methionine-sulfoxide reductase heme-binding subunit MsrQ [Microbulbifer]|uniref:Protein-methionine-sulfoxide reductase heme-binding subunit MsrQ n=1 Tax=Microbulbifer celer TaxID=435905 RepID=A0ABW3U8C5_9GAMM|nr:MULTISPECIES: protein-methionine-sulfoxide reductase heme-binding subunit MsrQ [Microbulbifer]UFN56320.1 protein-methionine-sulfoxide reductase heme-binding subunit MsrQ [Microbulbifer celer]
MAAAWKKPLAIALQVAVHLGALAPLVWLFYAINAGHLGGDPVKELIHYLGMGALRLLLLTLLVTPLAKLLHFGQLNRLRRPLGLWCFTWASLHFCAWLALDLGLDWSLIGSELIERTYILVGFSAWLILLALAVTSIPALLRRMGKHWKKLHGLLYIAALLGCWHFWWSVKSGWIEPAIYLTLACVLLWWRKDSVVRWLRSFTR